VNHESVQTLPMTSNFGVQATSAEEKQFESSSIERDDRPVSLKATKADDPQIPLHSSSSYLPAVPDSVDQVI
jgi:hypothetical protein